MSVHLQIAGCPVAVQVWGEVSDICYVKFHALGSQTWGHRCVTQGYSTFSFVRFTAHMRTSLVLLNIFSSTAMMAVARVCYFISEKPLFKKKILLFAP